MIDNFTNLAKEAYRKNHRTKMERFEREAIIKTLKECNKNVVETSGWLGYTPQKLRRRMKELKIFIIEVAGATDGRKSIIDKQLFFFNKYDRACLDDLMELWQNSCHDIHGGCDNCPKSKEICQDITYKTINKIYDKTGK